MFLLVISFFINFSAYTMMDALNTAASGMEAQKTQIDVIANNFANINTNGFKKSRVDFETLQYKTVVAPGTFTSLDTQHPTGVQIGKGVRISATKVDLTDGSIKPTGNPYDLAISGGDGYFAVQYKGQVYYTKDGGFNKAANGLIVNNSGAILTPEITVPENSAGVTISTDGVVSASQQTGETQEIGQIQLVSFASPGNLLAKGGNLFLPSDTSGNPVAGVPGTGGLGIIQQGFIEGSNVNAVTDMVNMISAQRAYELNSKVIQTSDQMLQSMNNMR